jgi:hypothetical protein
MSLGVYLWTLGKSLIQVALPFLVVFHFGKPLMKPDYPTLAAGGLLYGLLALPILWFFVFKRDERTGVLGILFKRSRGVGG